MTSKYSKILGFGCSMTADYIAHMNGYYYHSVDADKPKIKYWPDESFPTAYDIVAERCGAKLRNLSVAGASNQVICSEVLNATSDAAMMKDVDLILVGLTNMQRVSFRSWYAGAHNAAEATYNLWDTHYMHNNKSAEMSQHLQDKGYFHPDRDWETILFACW